MQDPSNHWCMSS